LTFAKELKVKLKNFGGSKDPKLDNLRLHCASSTPTLSGRVVHKEQGIVFSGNCSDSLIGPWGPIILLDMKGDSEKSSALGVGALRA